MLQIGAFGVPALFLPQSWKFSSSMIVGERLYRYLWKMGYVGYLCKNFQKTVDHMLTQIFCWRKYYVGIFASMYSKLSCNLCFFTRGILSLAGKTSKCSKAPAKSKKTAEVNFWIIFPPNASVVKRFPKSLTTSVENIKIVKIHSLILTWFAPEKRVVGRLSRFLLGRNRNLAGVNSLLVSGRVPPIFWIKYPNILNHPTLRTARMWSFLGAT